MTEPQWKAVFCWGNNTFFYTRPACSPRFGAYAVSFSPFLICNPSYCWSSGALEHATSVTEWLCGSAFGFLHSASILFLITSDAETDPASMLWESMIRTRVPGQRCSYIPISSGDRTTSSRSHFRALALKEGPPVDAVKAFRFRLYSYVCRAGTRWSNIITWHLCKVEGRLSMIETHSLRQVTY